MPRLHVVERQALAAGEHEVAEALRVEVLAASVLLVVRAGVGVEEALRDVGDLFDARQDELGDGEAPRAEGGDRAVVGGEDRGLGIPVERIRRHAQPQAADVAPQRGDVVVHGGQGAVRVSGIVAGDGVQRICGVGDRPRQRADVVEVDAQRHDAADGTAPVGRLEAHGATEECGQADRAAGVGSEGEDALTGGGGGARATRRAARLVAELAGILHPPEGTVPLGDAGRTERLAHVTQPAAGRTLVDHEGEVARTQTRVAVPL